MRRDCREIRDNWDPREVMDLQEFKDQKVFREQKETMDRWGKKETGAWVGPLVPGGQQGRWDLQDLLVLASQGLQEVKATWETMESEDNLDKKVKKVHKEIWSLLQEIQVRKDRKVYLESLDQKVPWDLKDQKELVVQREKREIKDFQSRDLQASQGSKE